MNAQPADIAPARPRAFGFEVPHWAHYAAVDGDGRAFAFACEPTRFDRWRLWNAADLGGRAECIGEFGAQMEGWMHSLLKFDEAVQRWVPMYAYQVDREPDPEVASAESARAAWLIACLLVAIVGALVCARLGWLP